MRKTLLSCLVLCALFTVLAALPASAADLCASPAPAAALEPNYVCLSGWCSSNTQCVTWYGSGYTCRKASGATCGQCVSLALAEAAEKAPQL
jgi:hypothetical protein